jgi:hypothetical protein
MATKAVGNSDRFFVFRKSILDQWGVIECRKKYK